MLNILSKLNENDKIICFYSFCRFKIWKHIKQCLAKYKKKMKIEWLTEWESKNKAIDFFIFIIPILLKNRYSIWFLICFDFFFVYISILILAHIVNFIQNPKILRNSRMPTMMMQIFVLQFFWMKKKKMKNVDERKVYFIYYIINGWSFFRKLMCKPLEYE